VKPNESVMEVHLHHSGPSLKELRKTFLDRFVSDGLPHTTPIEIEGKAGGLMIHFPNHGLGDVLTAVHGAVKPLSGKNGWLIKLEERLGEGTHVIIAPTEEKIEKPSIYVNMTKSAPKVQAAYLFEQIEAWKREGSWTIMDGKTRRTILDEIKKLEGKG